MADSDYKIVFDLQYMKKTRFTLNCLGLWPNKQFGDKSLRSKMLTFYNHFLFIACFLAIISEIMYLQKNNNVLEFIDLGHTYITILMSFVYIQRLTLLIQKKYILVIKEFVTKFHIIHYRNKSQYTRTMNDRVEKICAIVCLIIHYQMYMGLSMFNLVPLYNNYKHGMYSASRPVNGTFEHAVYYQLPFDQYTDPYYYTFMFFFNWYVSYNVSSGICIIDLLICILVIHLWGHISILKHDLDDFPRPEPRIDDDHPPLAYTAEENLQVFHRLKGMIQHHKEIKDFMSKTSDSFSVTLCLYYAFHQLAGCVLLLECSSLVIKISNQSVPRARTFTLYRTPEALGKYAPLTLILFQQLIQLSVIFELISAKGDTLVGAVYGLPWECMDTSNRRLVVLFLQNVQIPLALKAGDMVPVGVTTMSAILKTSCSYFIMLTALDK